MRKRTILTSVLLVLLLLGGFTAWKIIGPGTHKPDSKYFYIKTGSDYETVKASLLSNNIVSSPGWFDFIAKRLGYPQKVKPGRYEIRQGMSLLQLVRMLRAGNQSPVNWVVRKLRTPQELAAQAARNFECDSAGFMAFLQNADSLKSMSLDSNTFMTAILPNTYSLQWNSSPAKIFRRLYTESQQFWTAARKQKAEALNLSPQQVYTLASIVEEETNMEEDKGKIASVYLNRLETGMKLGADPTVKFALKDFGLKRILNMHLTVASPYNTYQHNGLPPGPICTPSAKTIDATLNAPSTDYLFFVAQPNLTGYSNFAATYDKHMAYARIYQQWIDSFLRAKAASKNDIKAVR